jgi:phosphatidylserine/phosphatidylglycerophosphate/cardiolipin synthase-like enzyme
MSLSNIIKYCSLGFVAYVSSAELYHRCSVWLRRKFQDDVEDDEINEIVYTRSSRNQNTKLTRHIVFVREPAYHALEIISNLILSAQKSVYVAVYIFSSDSLARALITAKKKGVDVKVVLDASMEIASHSKLLMLRDSGVSVKIHDASMMHLKLCVIDVSIGQKKKKGEEINSDRFPIPSNGLIITGSLNWTREALTSNEENFIVTSNANLCRDSAKKFCEIWKSSRHFKHPQLC